MSTTYSEKLTNPKWQKKRLEVLSRDQFTCCLCSDKENTLHVHHKTYKKGCEPWEYPLDNFQTLCKDCHFIVEENKGGFEVLAVGFTINEGVKRFATVWKSPLCYGVHIHVSFDGEAPRLVQTFTDSVIDMCSNLLRAVKAL